MAKTEEEKKYTLEVYILKRHEPVIFNDMTKEECDAAAIDMAQNGLRKDYGNTVEYWVPQSIAQMVARVKE